ncbi:Zinc finger CCCH domain-containing protein 65 [Bienertia sinuspersici]
MKSSNDDGAPSLDPIKGFFGPPPPRRPIPSYSFNTLVKIFSLFSDQNPFSHHASSAIFSESSKWDGGNQNNPKRPNPGDVRDDSIITIGEDEASGELIVPANVEVCNFPLQCAANNDVTAKEFSMNDSSSGVEIVMNELCLMTEDNKTTEKMASHENGHDARMSNGEKVPGPLSGIERRIMDELYNMGLLELPEKDVNFASTNDFGSISDTDVCIDNVMVAESSQTGKVVVDGNMKEEVAGDMKRKGVEVNRSITGCHAPKTQDCLPVDRATSNQEEIINQHTDTCLEYSQNVDKKLCTEKDTNKLVESKALTFIAQTSENGGGIGSVGNFVESVGKGSKFDVATRGKTIKANNASLKDGKSEKVKHKSANGEIKKSQPESIKGFCYTRQQLLHLRNLSSEKGRVLKNMNPFSEDVVKALQEIGVDLLDKGQHSVTGESRGMQNYAGVFALLIGMMDLCEWIVVLCRWVRVWGRNGGWVELWVGLPVSCKVDLGVGVACLGQGLMLVVVGTRLGLDVMGLGSWVGSELGHGSGGGGRGDSGLVKNKKRGSSSEARKEKKKREKRKKRAEMNKKLGVKRLKLKPVLKPKVVPPCRHYLNGRCQQPCCHFARNACMKGDDCPFDHQLSKYPCKNYVDTGFCIRGESCSFSHKVSATEGSKIASGSSNCESNLSLKPDASNSKHHLSASFATPNCLEDLAKQTSLPAIAPKGLSFLSFGKSSVENSAKHKESEIPLQHNGDAPGTHVLPNIVAGTASRRNGDGAGMVSQLNQGTSSSAVNVSQIKGNLAPISLKEIDLPSNGPSCVISGGKSQATMPNNELINPQIREKGSANESDKLIKPGSSTALGQCSINIGEARSKQSSAQRALLSTLAFAAKLESGIKMTSVTPSKELNKDGRTISDNECRHNEESKASAILDFLYSGGNTRR